MIFGVDFDGTIVEHKFPEIGDQLPGAILTMKMLQQQGDKIIIWTCRCEPHLTPMSRWLFGQSFIPDAVNSNLVMAPGGFAMPKIYADVYLDDKSYPPFPGWDIIRKHFIK